jgi:quercetin dioxygenase-like cupin family protein
MDAPPFVIEAGAARTIDGDVGGHMRVLVPAELTDGRIEAYEQVIEPGHGPPLHVHDSQDEAFVVLAGRVRFVVGDEDATVGPGASALAPRGVTHAFQVLGGEPARLLVTFTPAGIEPFFDAASQLRREDADRETLARLAAECGMRIVGPSLPTAD